MVAGSWVGHRLHVTKKERCETDVYVELENQCLRECAGTIGENVGGGCSHVCGWAPPDYEEKAELACGHL